MSAEGGDRGGGGGGRGGRGRSKGSAEARRQHQRSRDERRATSSANASRAPSDSGSVDMSSSAMIGGHSASSAEGGGGRGRGGRGRGGRGRGRGGPPMMLHAGAMPFEPMGHGVMPPPSHPFEPPQLRGRARGGHRGRGAGGAHLSHPHPPPVNGAMEPDRPRAPSITRPQMDFASLRLRLEHELTLETLECIICLVTIRAHDPIASCPTCHGITHLKCLRTWADKLLADASTETWRCPSCSTPRPADEAPRVGRCFCSRVADPHPPRSATPHSCAQPCGRKRDCEHACTLQCHPGPCDPCVAVVRRPCHCGRTERVLRCSAIHQAGPDPLSCGQPCARPRSCGIPEHVDEAACHDGPCKPCEVEREKRCYCGAEAVVEECGLGGKAIREPCHRPDERGQWLGEFSCGAPCPWKFDCGIHDCNQEACHAHPSARPAHCPRSPDLVTYCPCGQTSLSAQRSSCADPVPTCGRVCGRSREHCDHTCSARCHEGPCPPCRVEVLSPCRCGSDQATTRACADTIDAESGEVLERLCNRSCRATRNCGKHVCARRCCPLSYHEGLQQQSKQRRRRGNGGGGGAADFVSEAEQRLLDPNGLHECDRICARPLACGNHTCPRRDHRGPCGRCLEGVSFDEAVCHCGATVIMPPVPCGTELRCSRPCAREPRPCGHPKDHACHEEPECPPCPYLTDKTCMCDKAKIVHAVKCSTERVSCGDKCGLLLACGFHRCRKSCHPPGECEAPCTQPCGKPRKFCAHPHEAACHAPSSCSVDEPCPSLVEIRCECGHMRREVRCNAGTAKPTPASERVKLPCSDACAKAKRADQLADALGVDKSARAEAVATATATYEDATMQTYASNPAWARSIEQQLHQLIENRKPSHLFPPMRWAHRQLVHDLCAHMNITAESLDAEPNRAVFVALRADSAVAKPTLAEAYALAKRALATVVPPPIARRSTTNKPVLNALLLKSVFGDELALRHAIDPLVNASFSLVWSGDEDVIFRFNDPAPTDAESRLRSLRSALAFHNEVHAASVEGVRVDPTSGEIVARESTMATHAASSSTPRGGGGGTSSWASRAGMPSTITNSFAALSEPTTIAAEPKQRWTSLGGVVPRGLNQAPYAVVAPSRMPDHLAPQSGSSSLSPPEDWEADD